MNSFCGCSKFGKISHISTLVSAMSDDELKIFKQFMFNIINTQTEQAFIIWVLRNVKHTLGDHQVYQFLTKAKELTANRTIEFNDGYFGTIPDDIVYFIGSFMMVEESVIFGRTNKRLYLHTQQHKFLQNTTPYRELTVNDHMLNKLGWNVSNPHVYGAPASLKLNLKTKLPDQSRQILCSSWYRGLHARVCQIHIFGGSSLYMFGLTGAKSLFNGINRQSIELMSVEGEFESSKLECKLFVSVAKEITKTITNLDEVTKINKISITPTGDKLNWTSLLSCLSKCYFKKLTLRNTRTKIPNIFHSRLVFLEVYAGVIFYPDWRNTRRCKLKEVYLHLNYTNIVVSFMMKGLLVVLRKCKLIDDGCSCKLCLFTGKFGEFTSNENGETDITPENKELVVEMFCNSNFNTIVVEIHENRWMYLMEYLFCFLTNSDINIAASIKKIIFDIRVEDIFPLVVPSMDGPVYDIDQTKIYQKVEDRQNFILFFSSCIYWLNSRWQKYSVKSGQIEFDLVC